MSFSFLFVTKDLCAQSWPITNNCPIGNPAITPKNKASHNGDIKDRKISRQYDAVAPINQNTAVRFFFCLYMIAE